MAEIYDKTKIEKIRNLILGGIATGSSLSKVLRDNKKLRKRYKEKGLTDKLEKNIILCSRTVVYEWLNPKHKDFSQNFADNYASAQAIQADGNFETVQRIADGVLSGKYKAEAGRVAIGAYQWIAGKQRPNKYGDRLRVDMDITEVKPIVIKDFDETK